MHTRAAYLPLSTYPETAPDDPVSLGFRSVAGVRIARHDFRSRHSAVEITVGQHAAGHPGTCPHRRGEESGRFLCVQGFVRETAKSHPNADVTTREIVLGDTLDAAAAEARNYDLSILPWTGETFAAQDMAQAVVFGSGRPAILVPSSARPAPLEHIAVAWDASRVAARALWDALASVPENCCVTVLTIRDEKPLSAPDLAASLATMLGKRGYAAKPLDIILGDKTIAAALQDAAVKAGAQILVMGGFGHTRLRDFILGGATQGVFRDLRLPVLLSH